MCIVNKEISFDEYLQLMRCVFIQVGEHPVLKSVYSIPFDHDSVDEEEEEMHATDYAATNSFREDCMRVYTERLNMFLLRKRFFTFVDAIEEVINLYEYGSNVYSMPKYNNYIPARHTIMKRPNLSDERADDLSY